MAAVSSAILGAPISTILIIFELTGDYQITLALMPAVVMANLITHHFLKSSSFFHLQLKRSGKDLEGSRAQNLSRQIKVKKIMTNDLTIVGTDTDLERVKNLIINSNNNSLFVIDESFNIHGIITLKELRHGLDQDIAADELNAEMICRKQSFHLSPNDTLEQAIYLFKQTGEEYIAILDDKDQTKIIGVLSQRDLLRSYNKVLIEAEDL